MPARRRKDQPAPDAQTPEEALEQYGSMRDFERTPEPSGAAHEDHSDSHAPLTFVVQKHRATRLHYDLRLEVDGAMPSWPVPKGPAAILGERRLAVMTEPHPMDYAVFEGLIPKGQYGAGEVIVWDRGTFSPDEDGPLVFEDRAEANRRMRQAIMNGKVSVTMRGHRMKGSWALVKTQQSEDSWLLIKHKDEAVSGLDLAEEYEDSVLSGLTIADLQGGRKIPPTDAPVLLAHQVTGAKRGPVPRSVEPMQAQQTREPFSNPGWVYEPKLDGIRAVATLADGEVSLITRRGNDVTPGYPGLAAALGRQPANSVVFDGEIVAFDDQGVPSFERLQQRMNLTNAVEIRQAEKDVPVVYFVFDLLYLDGVDLRGAPLEERRRLLQQTLMPQANVQLVDQLEMDGVEAYHAVVNLGLEGLVAKRRGSTYTSGARSHAWVKVKDRTRDEFVVIGYTKGLNSRSSTFGALAIATRDGEDDELSPVGRVGSGFDEQMLKRLLPRLQQLAIDEPVVPLSRELRKDLTPVRPELVVEVEYTHRTSEGNLRAPVFIRLREDKAPSEVRSVPPIAPPAILSGSNSGEGGSIEEHGAAVLGQLESLKKQGVIEVGGAQVPVSNLDKVMWPQPDDGHEGQRALTKRDLIGYYARMAPYIINQVRDRPLTMTRYPNGVDGKFFYQKHVDDPPDFIDSVLVHTETGGGDQQFLLVNNVATLVWLAQMADLAIHTSLARVSPEPDGHAHSLEFSGSRANVEASLLNYPDFVLFDLDPYIYRGDEKQGGEPEYNRRAFEATCDVAGWLKELLDSAGMSSFVKTSGATGLHIYVPVLRQYDYETIREVAHTLGAFLVRMHPKEVTTEWVSEKRRGKVFFDANQNARIKNLACAYSPRAKPGAPVSIPLKWTELGKVMPSEFTILNAHERVERVGDLWAHILDAKHDLEALTGE
ncbi:MAG: non-homologous end-joining DNA ligase [Dehalococcoidia bacterium]|nr:non-homologous end-joining DNA ligase [Dehalococcoidia bacterium]